MFSHSMYSTSQTTAFVGGAAPGSGSRSTMDSRIRPKIPNHIPTIIHPGNSYRSFTPLAAINYEQAATTTNFEPILDIPALGTFVLVVLIFGALITRTNQVEASVQERNLALGNLRAMKSKQLIEDNVEAEVAEALRRYEDAVIKEEALRNVIPGVVRIVPPSSADSKEEEARVIAKQFLGKDYDIGVSREPAEEGSNLSRIATTVIPLILILFLLYSVFAFLNLNSMSSSGMIYDFDLTTSLTMLE